MMVASLLTDEPLILRNMPDISDIHAMRSLLETLGVEVTITDDREVRLHNSNSANTVAPAHLVEKMRASVMVLGPLLAQRGAATIPLPGGCVLGPRPVDQHQMAMECLGATVQIVDGAIHAQGQLTGGDIRFDIVTVTGAQNAVLAAVTASGSSTISNVPTEPEFCDFLALLSAMGASISGVGSRTLHVVGRPKLQGAEHRVMADRIVCGTWLCAAAATGGTVTVVGSPRAEYMAEPLNILQSMQCQIQWQSEDVLECRAPRKLQGVQIQARPYPSFPTDLQPQFLVCCALASGRSEVIDQVFSGRWAHIPELTKLGASIQVRDNLAVVEGVSQLQGTRLVANDMRGGAALVIAGLASTGQTELKQAHFISRGYENFVESLQQLGADIKWSQS